MATVSNPFSSPQMQPLPVPERRCVLLKKILAVVERVFLSKFFLVGGLVVGLSVITSTNISLIFGLLYLGSVALGVVSYLALRCLKKENSSYRLATLRQIEPFLHQPKVKAALIALKKTFANSSTYIDHANERYALHNQVTLITEGVAIQRPDLLNVWKTFLRHLHGKPIQNPDGKWIPLDFSMELERLKGGVVQLAQAERLDSSSSTYDRDLDQIERIQQVALGGSAIWSKVQIKKILASNPINACIVVRKKQSNEILGFAFTGVFPEGLCLIALARKPGACRLGIGDRLLSAILETVPDNFSLSLQVRKSNKTAIALYERHGFWKKKELKHYYNYPIEIALLMELKRARKEEAC